MWEEAAGKAQRMARFPQTGTREHQFKCTAGPPRAATVTGVSPWYAQQARHEPRLASSHGMPSTGVEPWYALDWRRAMVCPRLASSHGIPSTGVEPVIVILAPPGSTPRASGIVRAAVCWEASVATCREASLTSQLVEASMASQLQQRLAGRPAWHYNKPAINAIS